MTTFDKVRATGFHVEVVEQTLAELADGSLPEHFVFTLATSFDDESVFRHLDYVGLGVGELIAVHVDELSTGLRVITTLIPLRQIGPVELAQVMEGPGHPKDLSGYRELHLHVGVDMVSTIELERAECDDPQCDFDHGYSGLFKKDGITLRFDANQADLAASSRSDVVGFARAVSAAVARA